MIVEPGEEIINRSGTKVVVVSTFPNGDLLVYTPAEKILSLPTPVKILFKSDLALWRKEDL